MLGEDHVAVGTDMGALAQPAVATYRDLRAAFETMQRLGTAREVLEKIAIGNYARVLKTAMQPQA